MSKLQFQKSVEALKIQLQEHELYHRIQSLDELRVFMEHHVYAVWDFMSLLKSLQAKLTCVSTPWVPTPYTKSGALINRIVVEEESDVLVGGGYCSHFELYLQSMQEVGASTSAMEFFVTDLKAGVPWRVSLESLELPVSVHQFVSFHLNLIETADVETIAAVFAYTREDLVPVMFEAFLKAHPDLELQAPLLKYYLERHVELDGGEHSQMAEEMVLELMGEGEDSTQSADSDSSVSSVSSEKWARVSQSCQQALQLRIALWDGVIQGLADSDSIHCDSKTSDTLANSQSV